MTVQPAPYPTDATSVESPELVDAMDAEFAAWCASLLWSNGAGLTISAGAPVREFNKRVYPHPAVEGGLPEGWDLRWMSEQPAGYLMAVTQPHHLCVVHRRAGGWALMVYRTKKRAGRTETNLWIRGYPTVADLHTGTVFSARNDVRDAAVDEVRRFVVSRFDLTDPAEAAEATLVGLGGPLTVFKRREHRGGWCSSRRCCSRGAESSLTLGWCVNRPNRIGRRRTGRGWSPWDVSGGEPILGTMTSPSSSPAEPWETVSLEELMEGEFWAFRKMLPRLSREEATETAGRAKVFPHPLTAGGLPSGWVPRWHAGLGEDPSTLKPRDGEAEDLAVLVERTTGGWGLCLHTIDEAGVRFTMLWPQSGATLTEFYERTAAVGDGAWIDGLRQFILSHYNMADPTEAAEATLVGLGGPITVTPRSLTEQ